MNILSLFAVVVFAAESILAPVPQSVLDGKEPASTGSVAPGAAAIQKPSQSFGDLTPVGPGVLPLPDTEVSVVELLQSPTPTPTATPAKKPATPAAAVTPAAPAPVSPSGHKARKPVMAVAVLGDSMVDTLGRDLGILQNRLQAAYPGTRFNMYNHGVGATNIDYGITRITNSYSYLGMQLDSVAGGHPDIVVIESFAYNPFPVDNGLDRHWLALAKAVDTVRSSAPEARIVIAVTIAPNRNVFGDGAAGLSFSMEDKAKRTDVIKSYLENAVRFARGEHLPLADAYHPSMDANGVGKIAYINEGDHIHYSGAGRTFFSNIIADTIIKNRLLE